MILLRPDTLTCHGIRLELFGNLDAVGSEWRALAAQTRNIFATWEFASIWWRHFGKNRPLRIICCRSADDRLIAILPLYQWSSSPLRVIRFLGHGPGDRLGPICAPADYPIAIEALRLAFSIQFFKWDVFLGERLIASEPCGSALSGRTLVREGYPIVRLSYKSWDEFLASRSVHFRGTVRRFERKLVRERNLSYRALCHTSLNEDLDTVFALHDALWKGCPSSFFRAHEAFHREFAACAQARGWLRIWFLELDGKSAAAWLGFRFGDAEFSYQGGRDIAWERYSVGLVLFMHTIREALQDGMTEYLFLRGGEKYKYRLADYDPGIETFGLAKGVFPQNLLAAAAALRHPDRRFRLDVATFLR